MTFDPSPFALSDAQQISPEKFSDPNVTAKGESRARIGLRGLETLWFNTGTLCNLACTTCYIESSPRNDALVYIETAEIEPFLDEIARDNLPTREIAFTGGEPFMNPEMLPILRLCLGRGFDVLVLSNAMRPMRRFERELLDLESRERLTIRVSLDHFTPEIHEAERGPSWEKAIDGLLWLTRHDFNIAVAGRQLEHESDADARRGFAKLFDEYCIPVDADDPSQLVLFPAMDETADIAEITNACWSILGVDPNTVMCATSRMVVKRKGEEEPRVAACTLLPYQAGFDLGSTLAEASGEVSLNHPHCARFCVLGGASCTT
ncbi:MAG: radical SAM protein [Erythrobacter sp.]|nr:radical SAM protein [Erythrobacter sp.]